MPATHQPGPREPFVQCVTSTGMHIAIFAAKLHARILRPGLSTLEDVDAAGDLRRTLRSIDSAINSLVAKARIAG